jgi:hypothetical protein
MPSGREEQDQCCEELECRQLTYRFLEPGDKVIPVLVLLQTSECHLGAGDVLHGVRCGLVLGHC